MRATHVALPWLLALLACTGNVFAQDKVVMRPPEKGEPVIWHGRITFVNLEKQQLTLMWESDKSLIYLNLHDIETIEASNPTWSAAWETYDEGREDGGLEGGDRGDGLEDDPGAVKPTPKEHEEIQKLIARLGDDPGVELELAVKYGRKATMQLAQALRSQERDQVREAACRVLGKIGGVAALDDLLQRVDDWYPGARREAVIALGELALDDKRVLESFRERARKEEVSEVMRALVSALGKAAAGDSELRRLIQVDSYDAKSHMTGYYAACLAMAGLEQEEVGERLEQWMGQGMRDDVFFATSLANLPARRDAAIEYLIVELRQAAGDRAREVEIITALHEITGQEFGYFEAEGLAARAAAVKDWQSWWSKPTEPLHKPR